MNNFCIETANLLKIALFLIIILPFNMKYVIIILIVYVKY